MTLRRWVLVIAIGALVGGCASARESYLADVDEECAAANRTVATELVYPGAGQNFGQEDNEVLARRTPLLADTVTRIRALRAPAGDEQLLTPWLTSVDELVRYMGELNEDYRTAGPGSDLALALGLSAHDGYVSEASEAAAAAGLTSCAEIVSWRVFPAR